MRARGVSIRKGLRLVAMAALFVICSAVAVNASTIRLVEVLWETCSFGDVGVGHFEVDGKLAFCMEHAKTTPSTGTDVSAKVYDSAAVQKVLYYGYQGPAQWSGFKSAKNGIMVTSLMLSEVYTSAHKVGTYDEIPGLAAFRKYLANQPAPDLELKFDKENVKAYYDKKLNAERTEDITVIGTGTGKLTVNVTEGYLLHNNKTGEEASGSITLTVGDNFYIRTEGEYSQYETSEIKGKNVKLKPIVFVTTSTSLQDLTRLEYAEDTAEKTNLTIDWIGKLDLRINKTDLDTGAAVDGAVFRIYEYDITGKIVTDGKEATEYQITSDGSLLIEDRLQCGRTYVIEEISAPYAYMINPGTQSFEVTGESEVETVTFSNEKQYVYLVVNKTGVKHKIKEGRIEDEEVNLKGVRFEIMAANEILEWGTKRVLYKPGEKIAEIVTDENGVASTKGLPPGKYTISEIESVDGYIIDREAKTYDLRVDTNKKELKYTINLKNKLKETELIVKKYDKETREKLKNAYFRISNESGETLEVGTDAEGTARIKNLPAGKYTIKEVKAPKGYSIDTQEQSFTIGYDDDNCSVTIEAYDLKNKEVSTGDNARIWIYLTLAAVSIAGLLRLTIKKSCDKL